MKHSIKSYPILWMVIPVFLTAVGILVGSFQDYALSSAIVDVNNSYGRFVETFGMAIGNCIIMVGASAVWMGLFERKSVVAAIIGWLILLLGAATTVFFIYLQIALTQSTGLDQVYGLRVNKVVGVLLSILFTAVAFALTFFLGKRDDADLLVKVGTILLLAVLLQFLLVHFIKAGAGRPRYRYLIDGTLNQGNEKFRNFWEWQSGFKDDSHRSWPSGHSATAAVLILLPLLHPLFRHPLKHGSFILYAVGFAYYLAVAYGRVRVGAHFLTDVSWGGFFGFLMSFLSLFLANLIADKIASKSAKKDEKEPA